MADKFNVDAGVRPAPNLSPGAGGIGGNPGNVGSGLAQLGEGVASLFAGIQARQQQQAVTDINRNVANQNIMPDTIDRTGASPDANKTPVPAGGQVTTNTEAAPTGPLSRQEMSQLPPTVQTSMQRGGAMTAGYQQGKLQSVNYWQNISTMMRDDIAKNPAMAAQIEKAYERQYGFNPAKKYYEEWDKANAQNEANMKDADKQWRDLKNEASGMGISAEELRAGDSNPSIRESIQNRVYDRRAENSRRESILKNLEFAEKTGKANEETYFKAASEMTGTIIQSRFGNVMESVENTTGVSMAKINKKYSDILADNQVSPQEQQELQLMMTQFRNAVNQDYNTAMGGFLGKLSPAKRQELRKLVDDELTRLEDNVLTGKTGILEHNKRVFDLAKQGNAYAVMQQSPTVAAAGALDSINKDAANSFVRLNMSNIIDETSKVRLGVIGQKAAGGQPMGQTITGETQGATPQQKAEVADAAIKSAVGVIKNPNSSPEAVRVMAESLFAKGNMNMLNEHFTPNSRTKVFTALASPAMTQRMVEVGKTNPEALKNYTEWVTNNARVVMSTKIDDLKNHFSGGTSDTAQTKNQLKIGFDGQRFTVYANPEKNRIGASGRLVSAGGLGTAAISTGMRYTIEAVNDINRTLEALEPVMAITNTQKGGEQVNPILEDMLDTIGIGGAQKSDLQKVARAYKDYKLSQEQTEAVAGKKSSIQPDKSGAAVDNTRQATPMATDEELPDADPVEMLSGDPRIPVAGARDPQMWGTFVEGNETAQPVAGARVPNAWGNTDEPIQPRMGPVLGARDPSQWVPQEDQQVQEATKNGRIAPVAPARDPKFWAPTDDSREFRQFPPMMDVNGREPRSWPQPVDNWGREPRSWPEQTVLDNSGREIRTWPKLKEQIDTEGGYWVPRLQPNGQTVEVFVRKDGTPALNPDGTPMSKEQVGQQTQAPAETPRGGEERPVPGFREGSTQAKPKTAGKAVTAATAPSRPVSNPQGLRTFANAAEANNNPMAAGYIIPDDGSYNPGGDRSVTTSARNASASSPVATGGPLDLTRYYQKTMSAESSGNPNARAKTSSATGLFQFIDKTWKGLMRRYPELGLTADGRTDPRQQKLAMEKFTQENMSSLKKAGLPVSNGTLYLAHFAGDGGAKAILKADANTPVEKILKPEAIEANKFLRGKTAGWVIRWAERKMA